jgi:hypothetical protein
MSGAENDELRYAQAVDDFYTYRDYRRQASADRALRFVEACDLLLLIRPKRSRHGQDEEVEFDPVVLEKVRAAASAYATAKSTRGASRFKHLSFEGFRE